jgi:8-oxo-dGTP diphosphatase
MYSKTCGRGCCSLEKWHYTNVHEHITRDLKRRKAGVLIKNKDGKILIIQSRGNRWGPPKGTAYSNEDNVECAIRELHEETGVELSRLDLIGCQMVQISHISYYIYYGDVDTDLTHIKSMLNNDCSGIGWVYPDCLMEMVEKDVIKVTNHMKILLESTTVCSGSNHH